MSRRLSTMRKKLVGKYELGKILGEGNFAKVKLARNIETGELVAIKILNRDQVLQHKMVEQIKREISTMKVIKHSNVVKLYEVIASKTKIYIILEFVDGGEFYDIIAKNGRLKEEEARKYFQQLIDAVDFCHTKGVYHRDLKLDNLLVDSCGVLKVADFGLSTFSQQVREDGLLHTACGTPNYVAPEVFTDKGYDGTAADVWSCGIILFVLLAGYFPFDDENLINLHYQIQNAQFIVPPWLSFGAKRLIRSILDPNPLTRMTISEIMEDDWFKKDYNPPCFDVQEDVKFDDIDVAFNNSEENLITKGWTKPVPMNAFELISGSQFFNLESLFLMESGIIKQETRFTSQSPANEIMSKIEEAAKSLNFTIVKQNYKIKLQGHTSGRKGGCFSMIIEVFEVAQSFHVVELRNIGGDTLEFHKVRAMGALEYIAYFCTVTSTRHRRKPLQTVEIKVKMDCDGCERRVKSAVTSLKGVRSVEISRKQSKVTVTGHVDPNKVLKKVKKTGKKRAEFWPYIEHNLVAYPYISGAYDKRAPAGYVKDVPQAYPSYTLPQENFSNMFNDDNPNACSIM